jgi:hypothetical protein
VPSVERDPLFVNLTAPRSSPDGGGLLPLADHRKTGRGDQLFVSAAGREGNAAATALDVSKQLWTSEQAGVRDRLGLFAMFGPPTIAGGKVPRTRGAPTSLGYGACRSRPMTPAIGSLGPGASVTSGQAYSDVDDAGWIVLRLALSSRV